MADSKSEAIDLLHHCGDEVIEIDGKPLREYGWEFVDAPSASTGCVAIIVKPFREKFDMEVFHSKNIPKIKIRIAGVGFEVIQVQIGGPKGWTLILV
ncbi:hypothetical protein FJY63_14300 [Candidatus Sumerlaeota bacterium]|nr:hypothetical protein [Candidatus Sumerlaeota bacterium]